MPARGPSQSSGFRRAARTPRKRLNFGSPEFASLIPVALSMTFLIAEHRRNAASGDHELTLGQNLSANLRRLLALDQIFQLFEEFFYVLEVEVDRGKTNVGHFVVAAQAVHDEFAQFAGLALPLCRLKHKSFSFIHNLFQLA